MKTKRRSSIRLWTAAAAAAVVLVLFLTPAAAGDVVMIAPAYLNGLPEYTLCGSAGLANVVCDAIRAEAGADVALLGGGLFSASLPAGPVTYAELEAAVSGDADLVVTEVTGSELTGILDELMVYGSEDFPQLSGAAVLADRALTETGIFRGNVSSLKVGGEPAERDTLYSLVTTRRLYEDCHVPHQAADLGASLLEAMVNYGDSASSQELEAAAFEQRICIVSDSINLSQAAGQLMLRVPTPVVCPLSTPDLIPDDLMYALQGQDRYLCAWFPLQEIPYALCLQGSGVETPVSVPTDVAVTRQVPAGRKTANTFSDKTVFVDLRGIESIPDGSQVSVDLSGIYPPGMLLFLYFYDDNGDILPLEQTAVIAQDGVIAVPAAGGTTYVINDRQLNQTALTAPTPQHPWTLGVGAVFAAFAVWIIVNVVRRRRHADQ